MVDEPEVLVRLHRLNAEIRIDLAALEARAEETRVLALRWMHGPTLSRAEVVLVAF